MAPGQQACRPSPATVLGTVLAVLLACCAVAACTSVRPSPLASADTNGSGSPSGIAGASSATTPTSRGSGGIPSPGLHPAGRTQLAHVSRVVDGDTIHVVLNGTDERLRYIGVDTPEDVKPGTPVEPMSREAAAANRRLVADQDVILEKDVSERDRFGRLLRYVWLHKGDHWTMVGLQLVLEGYAQVATFPPDVRYVDLFRAAERDARQRMLGLWAPATTSPPR
jgi:micrococcal nuclease